jgi:hypothetical protein
VYVAPCDDENAAWVSRRLCPGQHQVRVEFDYDGDGLGSGRIERVS